MWNPFLPLDPGSRKTLGILAVLTVLAIWSLISGLDLVGPAKLPAPWQVGKAFVHLLWDPDRQRSLLLTAVLWSTSRVLIAGILVVLIGVPVGVLMGASPQINAALSPLVDPFRSAPVVALLPILVMWFGIGESMKIAFLFVGAVVFLVPMVRDAIQAAPKTYYVSAIDLGATPWEAVRLSLLPIAMPRIADGIIVSISVMWTYITVAEYVNAGAGLGQLIQNARRFSAMDQVFAGIFVIIALALITYWLLISIKRRMFPWENV